MRTRQLARAWVYRDLVAASLRKHANSEKLLPKGLTAAQVRRAQSEMLRLADWLEAKAAKLDAHGAAVRAMEPQHLPPIGE